MDNNWKQGPSLISSRSKWRQACQSHIPHGKCEEVEGSKDISAKTENGLVLAFANSNILVPELYHTLVCFAECGHRLE